MARFLFVVVPVVSHLWPAVAIGDALAADGHEVAWCGPEGDLRPLTGPGQVIYPTGKRSYRALRETGMAAVRELWDQYLLPLNHFISAPVADAIDSYQPDVIVADQYALAAAAAARERGIRWASLCAGILDLVPPDDPAVRDCHRERAGDYYDLLFSPHLVLATTTRALTGPSPLPERTVLIGAALGTRRTDPGFAWDWWDSERRHVLVTSGTLSEHLVRDFLARVVQGVAMLAHGVQVVLNGDGDGLPELPPDVLIAKRVPMLELMPRLDAVLCQAGQSTVNEALACGVPMVVAPIRLGELIVAGQVTRAGAGLAVSYQDATPAQLAAAITAVLDEPGYRDRARSISQEMEQAGGAEAAAKHLAGLAGLI